MINTVIVDDSIIFRNVIEGILEKEPQYNIVASFFNGKQLIDYLKKSNDVPDLITLDLEMPILDGIKTLKRIKTLTDFNPKLKKIKIVVLSIYSSQENEITKEALKYGAELCILKPKNVDFTKSIIELRHEFRTKITPLFKNKPSTSNIKPNHLKQQDNTILKSDNLTLSQKTKIEAIAIGVSTGGPDALNRILPTISARINQPIFIVQHIPKNFSSALAKSLDNKCKHKVVEATHNLEVKDNYIYIAPGGKHMIVKLINNKKVINLIDDEPVNNCKPSVDILFNSIAPIYQDRLIAIILTGMGDDGAKSLVNLKRFNCHTIAQDEKSSTVWGMPKAAIKTGYIDIIVGLDKIPDQITKIMRANSI